MTSGLAISDLADYLAGRWKVERTLSAGAERGSFTGVAEFVRDGAGLVWEEHGRLRWQRYEGPARRRLTLERDGDEGWEVRFADGRLFHALDLAGGASRAFHPCGEDRYEGEYRILDQGAFEVRWRVRGPRKDQEIVSTYRRA